MPLIPNVNTTGVAWTGSDADGWNLTITEPGSYRLMQDFTARSGASEAVKITVAGVTFDGGWNIIDAHGISTGISGSSSTVKNVIVKNFDGMSVMGISAKTIENVSVKDSRVGSGDSTNTNQINFIAVEISPDGTAVNVTIDGVTALVTERPQYGSGIYPVVLPEGQVKLTDSTITNISATGPFVTKGGSTTEYLTNFTVTGVAFMGGGRETISTSIQQPLTRCPCLFFSHTEWQYFRKPLRKRLDTGMGRSAEW